MHEYCLSGSKARSGSQTCCMPDVVNERRQSPERGRRVLRHRLDAQRLRPAVCGAAIVTESVTGCEDEERFWKKLKRLHILEPSRHAAEHKYRVNMSARSCGWQPCQLTPLLLDCEW